MIEKLKNGEAVSERYGSTLITAQKREQGDYIVARSKNGSTRSDTYEKAENAAQRFDRLVDREA